jgi:hypothetical protein
MNLSLQRAMNYLQEEMNFPAISWQILKNL